MRRPYDAGVQVGLGHAQRVDELDVGVPAQYKNKTRREAAALIRLCELSQHAFSSRDQRST